ncbi:helix-turn-helix transcriptional regulator [Streptomyces lunalinharesii]|uniref:Helix-turn-helix transcriptional regulator n=1 Tax=Streptomyces lunalinharesii TaxID=333384 RepID=A0ABN3SQZ9_9ACTN
MTRGGEGGFAEFLRSRREQLTPEEVGLPSHGRRRTPGLRRQELAMLAGLSVEYLERLEQGRDTNPSVAVLAALAEALRLSEDEKVHLAWLALKRHAATLLPVPGPVGEAPRASVRALLDQIDPTPACLLGPIYNLVAWNRAWEAMNRPVGALDQDRPNFIRYHFLHPMARQIFTDSEWASVADDIVGWLRSVQPDRGGEEEFRELVEELAAVPEFARRWETHPVALRRPETRLLLHPVTGAMRFTIEVLVVEGTDNWIQLSVPHDESTRSAMRHLCDVHALLRSSETADTTDARRADLGDGHQGGDPGSV